MKNRSCLFLIIPSAISFCVLISEPSTKGFVFASVIGLLLGALLWRLKARFVFSGSWIKTVIKSLLSLYVACWASVTFRSIWITSDTLTGLFRRINPDTGLMFRLAGYAGAVIALPFVYIMISYAVDYITALVKSVRIKEIWQKTGFSRRTIGKAVLISFIGIVSAVVLGTLLLVGAYSLPLENIEKNTAISAFVFEKEGDYPVLFSWCRSKVDNWTDSIMLLEAADNTEDTVIHRAMMAYRGQIGDMMPFDAFISHYISGEEFNETASYARYWHGYQIFLKPLLEFLSFDRIRILNGTVQFLLFLSICALMYVKGHRNLIIPYFLSYLMLMPITLGMCMQFSSCYYCLSFGMAALLLFHDRIQKKYSVVFVIFLITGILTAYFDFLTYPLATFGIPAILYASIQPQRDPESRIGHMIRNGIAWCIGFGGMWASKWLTASLLTDYNIFKEAFSAVSYRTSDSVLDSTSYFSLLSCARKNFLMFFNTPATVLAVIFAAYTVYRIADSFDTGECRRRAVPYILLSIAPLVWYAFAANHSSIHTFFTSNVGVISAAAVLFGLSELKKALSHDGSKLSEWI